MMTTIALPIGANAAAKTCSGPSASSIPKRSITAPAGSTLMNTLINASGSERDRAITDQVLSGNIPGYLRDLTAISISGTVSGGKSVLITLCVTRGYLAVGTDRDNVRVPMGLAAAARIAIDLGFFLPTTKMVDAIYNQASIRVAPSPMKPTSRMSSTAYLVQHNQTLEVQLAKSGHTQRDLTAGQKKDIVLSNRLRSKPGRVAIYGWHRTNGRPIQPLSTVHGAAYADYSHGVRLVSQTAYINGDPVALEDLMQDRELSQLVSSEGPIPDARGLIASLY
jgi:hypothetical protein